MMRLPVLALLVLLAACGSVEDPEVILDGTDTVQSDGDLTPDASLAPEAEQAPATDLNPEASLAPEADMAPENE